MKKVSVDDFANELMMLINSEVENTVTDVLEEIAAVVETEEKMK